MKLSNKGIYGVRAVFDIAFHHNGRASQIRDIAERQSIPPRFLEQIFQDLKRAGIVTSKRGPRGGYQLAKDPSDIRMGDVVRAVEGEMRIVAESDSAAAPADALSRTVTSEAFRELSHRVESCFDEVTFATLCERADALVPADTSPRKYVYSI